MDKLSFVRERYFQKFEQVDDFETISDSEKYTAYCTDRGLIYWL